MPRLALICSISCSVKSLASLKTCCLNAVIFSLSPSTTAFTCSGKTKLPFLFPFSSTPIPTLPLAFLTNLLKSLSIVSAFFCSSFARCISALAISAKCFLSNDCLSFSARSAFLWAFSWACLISLSLFSCSLLASLAALSCSFTDDDLLRLSNCFKKSSAVGILEVVAPA